MLATSAAGPSPGRIATTTFNLASQALNALLAFLLLVATLGWSLAAWASPGLGASGGSQSFRTPSDAQRGELLYRDKAGALWRSLPTLSTEVEIGIGGASARVALVQRFRNAGTEWLEGVYVFPLPETAAVDSLRVRIGDRVIEGRIAERLQAKRQYEQARDAGQRAGLVEQERPNIFTTSVANIGPGEEIEVRLGYAQTVDRSGLTYRLRFPMVVGPRYNGAAPAAQVAGASTLPAPRVADAGRITPPVVDPANGPINPVEIAVRLDPGFPTQRVNSPFHAIDSKQAADGAWTIQLADGAVPADRDFELEWLPVASTEPLARIFAETQPEARYALLTVMPPSAPEGTPDVGGPILPREAIFIIDTSGSMGGESIVQAKQALGLALSRLKPADRFNVIEFNSVTQRLFARAEPVTAANMRQALDWVSMLRATGGTEMRPALTMALDGNSDPKRLRQVVFLTDGAVGNEAELLTLVNERLGDTRLFTVGIGSAPNGYFMRKAAEAGRGSAVFIGKPEQVSERMGELFRRLERPAMTDLAVAWPASAGIDSLPNPLPDLYDGEPIVLAARLPVGTTGPVVLTGTIAGRPWRSELTLSATDDPPAGVPALWARRKVGALEDTILTGAKVEQIREQVIEVAMHHSLVTKYTSLVAVDATPARPETAALGGGMMLTNLPKGWNFDSIFGQGTPPALPTRGPDATPIRHTGASRSLLQQVATDRLQAQQAAAGAAAGNAPQALQAIALPQTATPAALLMLTGALLLGIAGFIVYAARRSDSEEA